MKNRWWINPYMLILIFIVPLYVFITCIIGNGQVNNFINGWYFFLGILYLLMFACGAFIGTNFAIKRLREVPQFIVFNNYLSFLAFCTIVAYVIWFREIFLHPSMIVSIISGEMTSLRSVVTSIPGITTFTQLGVVYALFYTYYLYQTPKDERLKRYRTYFIIILLLTLLRVVAWSERLALIEFLLPIIVVVASKQVIKNLFFKFLLNFGPYAGVAILIPLFSVTEYFRSWKYYKYYYSDFWTFMVQRISAYYYTALNNSAGTMTMYDWPTYNFKNILSWLYKMPMIGSILVKGYRIENNDATFLKDYANPEFTNTSGIYPVFIDIGVIGGIVLAAILGLISGVCYRHFIKGIGVGTVLYPIMYISILEILRILYLSDSRYTLIIVFALIGYWLSVRKTRRLEANSQMINRVLVRT